MANQAMPGSSSQTDMATMPGGQIGSNASTAAPVPSDQMDNSIASAADTGPTSPDGTPAFGIEPYFGILGGYHLFDRERLADNSGLRPTRLDGALISGVLGVNIPLGPIFVGVEGHGARGFGDIRWEYGVRGRGGFRIGDSGLIYGSAGYSWLDARNRRGFSDRKGWMYGLGVEAGPRDIGLGGITSNSGLRFRIAVETADFESIRPMAGVIVHF